MELCSLQLYFYIFHLQVKSEIYLPFGKWISIFLTCPAAFVEKKN